MYVCDTHALVYHTVRKSRLGKSANRIFVRAESQRIVISIPSIVLWEVVQLIEAGRVDLGQPFDHWCRDLERHRGFSIVPLDVMEIREARRVQLPDPADRLIVGTALRLDVPLITKDSRIAESGLVETIW